MFQTTLPDVDTTAGREEAVDAPAEQPPQSTPDLYQETPHPPRSTSHKTTQHRLKESPGQQEAGHQMKDVFNLLQNVVSKKPIERDEDECDLYGKILAMKLRKLSEHEREATMYEIDGIFLNRRHLRPESPNSKFPCSHPFSSASASTYSGDTTPTLTKEQILGCDSIDHLL